jgi:hypothetical protein
VGETHDFVPCFALCRSLGVLVAGLIAAHAASVSAKPPTYALQKVLPGSGFTYQGQLKSAGAGVTGLCNFEFSLWDREDPLDVMGLQLGVTQSVLGTPVSNGVFTAELNGMGEFGASALDGNARWLQIAVLCGADAGFTTLTPRQPVTPAPYALAIPGLRVEQKAGASNVIGGTAGNITSPPIDVDGATIGGGETNVVSGDYGTIPGGLSNRAGAFSFAAGRRAKAVNTGAFVWADSTNADFSSTADNQFSIRATNGAFIANDAGGAKVVPVGTRYRDNAVVAWGRVTAAASLDTNFNIASVVRCTNNAAMTIPAGCCWRAFKTDQPCAFKIDQGWMPKIEVFGEFRV